MKQLWGLKEMVELTSPFTFLLLLNSFITITLVLNQNYSAKDSASVQNSINVYVY